MTWFEKLTGFSEISPEQVRKNLVVVGDRLTSLVNHRSYQYGRLETPSLGELRDLVKSQQKDAGKLKMREVVANVSDLHANPANTGCLFQVASQFNLLEMVGPDVTPERGVGIYENDHTQGPTCAIAAGAGTIYRNYFAPVKGQPGQSAGNQIDCLADLGATLSNSGQRLWKMENGYALVSPAGLVEISQRFKASTEAEIDEFRSKLRIGVMWDTQVTLKGCEHIVTQAYCSALPVAYSSHPSELWEPFARLVLEASYEATICAAILNSQNTGNDRVFLTLLGGGAFGNRTSWILTAIQRALTLYRNWNLEVAIVSYGASKPEVQRLVNGFAA